MNNVCSKCNKNTPVSGSWCRLCRAKAEIERRRKAGIKPLRTRNPEHLKQGLKECFKCDDVKPLGDFSPAANGYGGRGFWCKKCCLKYARNNREKTNNYVYEYRKANKDEYDIQHRIYSQKRRALKKAADDGTVDTKYMLSLYEQTTCYYCKKIIKPKNRTVDHKLPLTRNGKHSKENLVMCCGKCNSSKRDKTEAEFLEYLQNV